MTPLDRRTAVVTGASRGIGLAIARQLEEAGAHVVRWARTISNEQADRHTDIRCDVTSEEDVRRAAQRTLDLCGVPDILVNNAGAFLLKQLHETTTEEFEAQVGTNLRGAFFVIRAFLPGFLKRRSGHIVNIGSVADHSPFAGNAAYGAGKYGLRGLHEALALELKGTGVRMTLISPGPTDTTLWDPMDPDSRADVVSRADMLRPVDVAEIVLFAVTRPSHVSVEWLKVMPADGEA